MALPVSVLITIVSTGVPQQGPSVPLALTGVTAPTFYTASTINAAGVTISNTNSATGAGAMNASSYMQAFPGLTNLNQLWFTGTAADIISVFAT